MRRLLGWLALLLLTVPARAGTELVVKLSDDANARIMVGSGFDHLPPFGYAQIEVKINNSSRQPRQWTVEFKSPGFGFYTDSVTFTTELAVQGNAARSFKLLVPLYAGNDKQISWPLRVDVSGPGADRDSTVTLPTVNRTGKLISAFIAMGERLAARSWSLLETELKDNNQQLIGTKFRPEEMPGDWRALVGIAGLWLTAEEANQLSPAQRGALHHWVQRGGSLFVCGGAERGPEFGPAGFGKIIFVPNEDLDVPATASAIANLAPTLITQLSSGYAGVWEARKQVGEITANVPLLIGFMAVFAALAGPVNLFVFAGRGRRHRLFWTTPLISLGASIVLFLFIVLQDGFGGSGIRLALVQLSSTEKKSVVLQEQIARTGVVRSSSFETREAVFIAPISLDDRSNPRANLSSRKYTNAGARFGGEWFQSRALQAHWIEEISSTRAEIAVLNPGELRDADAAPVILSTISATLEELYFCDEKGRHWHARNVRTGERTTLTATENSWTLLPSEAGPRLRAMWERVLKQPGHFYALSRDPGALIDTLPSIRWQNQSVLYFGRMTEAPAP